MIEGVFKKITTPTKLQNLNRCKVQKRKKLVDSKPASKIVVTRERVFQEKRDSGMA